MCEENEAKETLDRWTDGERKRKREGTIEMSKIKWFQSKKTWGNCDKNMLMKNTKPFWKITFNETFVLI